MEISDSLYNLLFSSHLDVICDKQTNGNMDNDGIYLLIRVN